MLSVLSYATQAVFFLVVVCFILYVLLELRVLGISRRVERHKLTELASQLPGMQALPVWPQVSVLLPIYNEAAVVVRLIDAVCRLQYQLPLLKFWCWMIQQIILQRLPRHGLTTMQIREFRFVTSGARAMRATRQAIC